MIFMLIFRYEYLIPINMIVLTAMDLLDGTLEIGT
jgi:hypothetical protein